MEIEVPENNKVEEPVEIKTDILAGRSIALTLQPKKPTKPAMTGPSPLDTEALKDIFGEDEEEKPRREAVLYPFTCLSCHVCCLERIGIF